jgi:methylenetetrahydrofolate reductase (NADPH)
MTMAGIDPLAGQHSVLLRLLAAPRFELLPLRGIEAEVATLPAGATVSITCSPRHGIDHTLDLSERFAVLGYRVIPHLAARMVRDRGHLERIVERLAAAGIDEVFVIGGDAPSSIGPYGDAGELLEALADLPHAIARIGIGGYPEGHAFIPQAKLLEALRAKQPRADYITTQICFDADALVAWIGAIRETGIVLPVIVGLPGVVDRRRLAAIALGVGVGPSLRYLGGHARELARLARARLYDPTGLAGAVAAHLDEPGLRIAGVHLFTFNRVDATQRWLLRTTSLPPLPQM